MIFTIADGKSPSYIINRFRIGKFTNSILNLDPYEAFYLISRERIEPENPILKEPLEFIARTPFPDLFNLVFPAYERFKQSGLHVKVEGRNIMFRRDSDEEYSPPFMVIREDNSISWTDLLKLGNLNFLILDDELDLTAFSMETVDPIGNHQENNSISLPPEINIAIFDHSRVPYWMGSRLGKWAFLNRFEIGFLERNRTTPDTIEKRVYNDLVSRGFIVRTGFKYGANFRIYSGELEDHADFLVHVFPVEEEWYKISRAVRVAHAVRKKMIFAGESEGSIAYRKIERIRDPVSSSLL